MKIKRIISFVLTAVMIFAAMGTSASAAEVYVNMNFESMEVFTEQFIAGAFYVEDGVLFGYAEAKALQTKYDDSQGFFADTQYTWLTYDATITFSIADDELSDTSRWVNLVYANDNPYSFGRSEDREMICFAYDVENRCFRLALGFDNAEPDAQLMPPVSMEMPTDDGNEFVTMGISVTKGNMRCYYNGQLIFNYTNPDMLIAEDITAPFLFWQDGNFIQIKNITVAEAGSLFSASTPGDATGDGKVNLGDVSLILKKIAKWDVNVDTDASDVNDDGKVNLGDVSLILKKIAKWDVVLK